MALPFNKTHPPAPGLPCPTLGLVHRRLVLSKTGLPCRGEPPEIQGCHGHTVWSWAAPFPSSASAAPAAKSRAQKGLKLSGSEVKESQNNTSVFKLLKSGPYLLLTPGVNTPILGALHVTHTVNTSEARPKSHRDDALGFSVDAVLVSPTFLHICCFSAAHSHRSSPGSGPRDTETPLHPRSTTCLGSCTQ